MLERKLAFAPRIDAAWLRPSAPPLSNGFVSGDWRPQPAILLMSPCGGPLLSPPPPLPLSLPQPVLTSTRPSTTAATRASRNVGVLGVFRVCPITTVSFAVVPGFLDAARTDPPGPAKWHAVSAASRY